MSFGRFPFFDRHLSCLPGRHLIMRNLEPLPLFGLGPVLIEKWNKRFDLTESCLFVLPATICLFLSQTGVIAAKLKLSASLKCPGKSGNWG